MCNIWQAAYTAGVVLPKPVSVTQYWHRSLNPKKLIAIGFSRLNVSVLKGVLVLHGAYVNGTGLMCTRALNALAAVPLLMHICSGAVVCFIHGAQSCVCTALLLLQLLAMAAVHNGCT